MSGIGNMKRFTFRFFCEVMTVGLVVSPLVLAGCAGKGKDPDVELVEKPDILYNKALADVNAGRFNAALKKFKVIDQQNPYSEWSRKSLVMDIFLHYHEKRYDDAINTAKRYIALYPVSDDSAYAYYIMGLSHYHQIQDVTRDQEDARNTVIVLQELVDHYLGSEYVADAKEKIRFAREQLSGKEMQVGRYYLERRQYLSAIKRFRLVVEQYSNTSQIEEALYRLVEANYAIGLVGEAQTAAYVLGQNYPASQWYNAAFRLLKKDGVNPQKGEGWLSSLPHFKKKDKGS